MNRLVRIQTWAGIGAVVSLPFLYIGAVNGNTLLEVFGFALFALSMLTTPVLRFIPGLAETEDGEEALEEEGAERKAVEESPR